ncbi:MAG: hypothetical protein OIF47_01405 [Marinibacterium sp.]|nr:hypothetical protein [Marinibacterium sp.]
MRPPFALTLTPDGIRLLHRSTGGWRQVGVAAPDSASLPADLAALRGIAEELEPGRVRCKLVLPDEQVRYLTVARKPGGDPEDQARTALEGATPYAVTDLAFDTQVTKDSLTIAAVTRDTLDEAESFARDHGFNPVSFVAMPADGQFETEPFFGPSHSVAAWLPDGETVEPDSQPIQIIGAPPVAKAAPPVADPAPAPPAPEPEPEPVMFRSRKAAATPPPEAQPSEARKPVILRATPDEAAPEPAPETDPVPEPKPEPVAPQPPRATRPAAPEARPEPRITPPENEAQRMTVFGAREKPRQRGKPRYLGLALTLILLVLLAGVAIWASLLGDRDPLSALWPEADEAPVTTPATTPAAPDIAALPAPVVVAPTQTPPRASAQAGPAVAEMPDMPPAPGTLPVLSDLISPELDAPVPTPDALGLPDYAVLDTDLALGFVADPPAPGAVFDLDDRGQVVATRDGALTPDGHRVYLGAPPARPAALPTRTEPVPEDDIRLTRLATLRPVARPGDLDEQVERVVLAGRTRNELASLRPLARPSSPQDAPAAEAPTPTPEALAMTASLRPIRRPARLPQASDTRSAAAIPATKPAAKPAPTEVAAVAPKTVKPKIPSSASVARQATIERAINLNRVNLIGVYGTKANRRALVRLSSGRTKKVKVGDRVDGGRVVAIGDSELRYKKGSRTLSLKMPKG